MEGMGDCISIKVESLVPLKVSGITFSEGKSVLEWVEFLLKLDDDLSPNVGVGCDVKKRRKEYKKGKQTSC